MKLIEWPSHICDQKWHEGVVFENIKATKIKLNCIKLSNLIYFEISKDDRK